MFISFLYMFRATMCPSSGKTTVFMRHLILVILYIWLSGMPDSHPYMVLVILWYLLFSMDDCLVWQTVIHTWYLLFCGTCYSVWMTVWYAWQSSIQNNKYQMSHKYSCFSWWWAHSRPKHVGKRNKHTKKNCAPSWLYLQDYKGMYGQQNVKFTSTI